MRIDWVNHASFIVQSGPVRLICDPWLEGTVFNDGWSHTAPTKMSYEEFSLITHIWFSHEHPDHFCPPNLRKIPEEYRRRITVLFHETKDKRVAALCRSLQFTVQELPNCGSVNLAPDFRVVCGVNEVIDSWVALFAEGKTLLNFNDCIAQGKRELLAIKEITGKVDVLLSQFSYANWVGNPDDTKSHLKHAMRKRAQMADQIRVFEPKQFIPFASFVYFCHEENFFMNQSANRIRDIHRFASHELGAETIVLYPGNRWEVGTARDSDESIDKYERDFDRSLKATPRTSPAISAEKLQQAAQTLVDRCAETNSMVLLRAMPHSIVRLTDLNQDMELSFRHGLREAHGEQPDIILSSDSLLYCLKTDWGGETLEINGRFQVPLRGHPQRFFQFFRVPRHNSNGNSINLRFLGSRIIEKARNALSA